MLADKGKGERAITGKQLTSEGEGENGFLLGKQMAF